MAYKVNGTAADFKRTFEQFQHVNAQVKQIQESFSRLGINDLGRYVEDILREDQRQRNEKAMERYIVTPSVCSNCGK